MSQVGEIRRPNPYATGPTKCLPWPDGSRTASNGCSPNGIAANRSPANRTDDQFGI